MGVWPLGISMYLENVRRWNYHTNIFEKGCYIIAIVGIVLGTLSLLAGGLGVVLLGAR